MKQQYTSGRMLDRWESLREVKNLMGRLSADYSIIQAGHAYDRYWSRRSDVCLGTNDGWYAGASAVKGYYDSLDACVRYQSRKIAEAFPKELGGKSDDEIYGVGMLDYKPVDTCVVEVAGDNQTAKGIWCIRGSHAKMTESGPVAYWEWGWFAADFVQEDGAWRIWHMQHLDDILRVQGSKWYGEETAFPARPEFAGIEDVKLMPPTHPAPLRELYHPDRPWAKPPRVPEPYHTFDETFSYGMEEAQHG